jgi:hypothetical protein
MDEYRRLHHKAIFQLRKRLPEQARKTSERRKEIAGTNDNGLGASENDDLDVEVLDGGTVRVALRMEEGSVEEINNLIERCEGKSGAGNTRPRARFGRRATHNEEICVASCGVMLGRATFFGSEAPNGVKVSHYSELINVCLS